MLTSRLSGLEPGSRLSQLQQQTVAQLRRVPLSWWQGLVVVLLLLVLANSAAQLLWLLFPDAESSQQLAPVPVGQSQTSAPATLAGVDISGLQALHLFGKAGAEQQVVNIPPPQTEIEAEETKLALKLTGATPSNVPSASWAMISHNNKQQTYRVGDKLPGGRQVTLDRVFSNRVILSNSGRYESLWLYEENDMGEPVKASGPSTRAPGATKSEPIANRQPTQTTETVKLPQSMPTAESLAEVVKFTLHKKGIQIRPGSNRTLFDRVGFKPGDVVTHINGASLQDPAQAKSLYQQVLDAQSAHFQILRNGEAIGLDVDIENSP